MKRKYGIALILAALLCVSSCGSAKAENRVTFRTVDTEGIIAHTVTEKSETSVTSKTVKTVFSEKEQTTVSMITHHYDTTIPKTLVGGAKGTEGTEETEETEITTAPGTANAPEAATQAPPPETTAAATFAGEALTTLPPQTAEQNENYAKIGENGILVIKQDGHYVGLMGCWGTYGLCERWAGNVNKFKSALPDVNVYNTVLPTSSEFYVPAEFSNFTGSQKGKADHVAGLLENVTNVDVFPALAAHLDERIYARTDHHWMPLGAYYAAEVFAEAAGTDFPDISEYKKVTAKNYVGSMYNYSKDIHLYNDPEDFDLYIPPNNDALKTTYYNTAFGAGYDSKLIISPDGGAYYCSFLGSDNRIAKIETDCKNGRTLVIFKESYGNGMVPFLTSSFETIYVCDIRYFDLNAVKFCKDVGATDLLFAVCTYTAAGTNGNYLSIILSQ